MLLVKTYFCHEDCQGGADAEMLSVRVEADHPVEDAVEHDGGDQEEGQFGELLGDEVGLDAVHVVLLLAHKDGDLGAEDVGHGHHVDEGERDQAHEEHLVDVLGSNSIVFWAQILPVSYQLCFGL